MIFCQVSRFNMQPIVKIITIDAILVLTNRFVALRAYQNFHMVFNTEKKKRCKHLQKNFLPKIQNLKKNFKFAKN